MKEKGSALSLAELPVGFEFPATRYELTKELVTKYLEAVDGGKELLAEGLVPPLAIAACAMATVAQAVTIPPGSIHASQDFEFAKPVSIGMSVNCGGRIAQKIERGGLSLIMLEIEVTDQTGEKTLAGKATIAAPK